MVLNKHTNKVFLSLTQDLQRLLLQLVNNRRGRYPAGRPIKYGMTALYNGFTLIELLVVVLIIGILAAVAVPQYKKAVLKAQLVQAEVVFDAYRKALELWVLENGVPEGSTWLTGSNGAHAGELNVSLPAVRQLNNSRDLVEDKHIGITVGITPSWAVRVWGYDPDGGATKWLNGCGVGWKKFVNHADTLWRYVGVVNADGNEVSTVPQGCEEVAKLMCEKWAPTRLLGSNGVEQCNSLGWNVTRLPYPDGV